MKKIMTLSAIAAIAVLVDGCTATTIEWGGKSALRDTDGRILTAADGSPYYETAPNRYHTNRHWTDNVIQEVHVAAHTDGSYEASVGKYESKVNAKDLVALMEASFKGATELSAKIGAAIATSGASVAGDAGMSALRSTIAKFLARGGDASKATVTCADGSCTVTDGAVVETCTDCMYAPAN